MVVGKRHEADLIREWSAFALMSPKGSSSRLPFLSQCRRSLNNRTDNIDNESWNNSAFIKRL